MKDASLIIETVVLYRIHFSRNNNGNAIPDSFRTLLTASWEVISDVWHVCGMCERVGGLCGRMCWFDRGVACDASCEWRWGGIIKIVMVIERERLRRKGGRWRKDERCMRGTEEREQKRERGNQLRAFVHMNVQAHYIIIDHRWLLFLSLLLFLLHSSLLSLLHASTQGVGWMVLVQWHVRTSAIDELHLNVCVCKWHLWQWEVG